MTIRRSIEEVRLFDSTVPVPAMANVTKVTVPLHPCSREILGQVIVPRANDLNIHYVLDDHRRMASMRVGPRSQDSPTTSTSTTQQTGDWHCHCQSIMFGCYQPLVYRNEEKIQERLEGP